MQKLVKPAANKKYVDLTVSFAPETDGEEDLPGPPVRYYFAQEDNWGRYTIDGVAGLHGSAAPYFKMVLNIWWGLNSEQTADVSELL